MSRIIILSEEDYLSQNGASKLDYGEAALHHNKGRNSDKVWSKMVRDQSRKDWELIKKRDALRKEYRDKVAKGEIRPPTRIEQLISIANGHEDLVSTRAARRLLQKKGIEWRLKNTKPHQTQQTDRDRKQIALKYKYAAKIVDKW